MLRLSPDSYALLTRREALVLKNLRECRYTAPLCRPLRTQTCSVRLVSSGAADLLTALRLAPGHSTCSTARDVGKSLTDDAGCCSVYILDYTSEVEVTDCVGCQIFLGEICSLACTSSH